MDKNSFTPVRVEKFADGYSVAVWNREYKFGASPLLSSVKSAGEELLAAPMRVVGVENGKEIAWRDVSTFLMDGCTDEEATLCRSMQGERFLLNATAIVFEDGCMDWYLNIAPRGQSVNQAFGLEPNDNGDRILSELWIEIPLKKEIAQFYQIAPIGKITFDGKDIDGALAQAGRLPLVSMEMPFKQQLFIGGDKVGFGVFFESDENWQPQNENDAISCVIEKDAVVLRIKLLDSEPKSWREKDTSNGMYLFPVTFRVGMVATPVKQFPENPYFQKAVHIDCFKKIPMDYEEYLFGEYEGAGETVLDKIKRQGVDTLYIHEKWNDIQNSPELTTVAADRLKLIVEEAHKRNIKVIPYFGYEISTLSPEFGKHGIEYMRISESKWHWYRKPWQRDLGVCYNSGWQDYFVENIKKLFETYHIDGLYLDSTMVVYACKNEKHGCGYRDGDGNLKETYPVFAVRTLMKRLHNIVKEYGGVIACHSYASFSLGTIAYADMLWEGESVQSLMLTGKVEKVPEDYFRAIYTGKNLGVPVNMLCYSNPPKWTFSQATANALPFGILPKPNDAGGFLDEMSGVWKALSLFDFNGSVWKPYYDNDIRPKNPVVVVSYYETVKQALFFVCNMKNKPTGRVDVKLPQKYRSIVNAVSGERIDSEKITVEFKAFDYVILFAEK